MHELSADTTQAALRPFRHFTSTDLDQTRDRIASVFCPHSLVPGHAGRAYETRMDLLSVAGLGFGTLHLGGAMSVHVPEMSDYYLLLLCLKGASIVSTEGAELTVSGKRGFLCNPGQRFTAAFSADAEQLFLRVARSSLWRHTGARHLRVQSDIDFGRAALGPAEASIGLMLSGTGTIGIMRDNPHLAQDYEQLFIGLLLAGQPHLDELQARRSGLAPATVRRAEEFIRANVPAAITLNDVAAASGVPVRTLLEAFRRFRDVSPMRMLRDTRLDLAREQLRATPGANVAAVALGCGFNHLGRFAQVYADRFGERPSETRLRGKTP